LAVVFVTCRAKLTADLAESPRTATSRVVASGWSSGDVLRGFVAVAAVVAASADARGCGPQAKAMAPTNRSGAKWREFIGRVRYLASSSRADVDNGRRAAL
jgi:hypothetical protein